jgi:DNA invertase Pin-like site-specific DNA recombinase
MAEKSKSKTCAIYTRVSTNRQDPEMQLRALEEYAESRAWTVRQVYEDQGYSRKSTKRPAYEDMIEDPRRRRFDVLLVWKLDRLSRSLRDLLNTLDHLSTWAHTLSPRSPWMSFESNGKPRTEKLRA